MRVIVSLHNTNTNFSGSTTSSCVTYFHCLIHCPFYFCRCCYFCLFAYLMFRKKNQVSVLLFCLQIHNNFLLLVLLLFGFICVYIFMGYKLQVVFQFDCVAVFLFPFSDCTLYTTTHRISSCIWNMPWNINGNNESREKEKNLTNKQTRQKRKEKQNKLTSSQHWKCNILRFMMPL